MDEDFKPGNVVQLKSGGPAMDVVKLDTYSAIGRGAQCVWFEKGKRQTAVFALANLRKLED